MNTNETWRKELKNKRLTYGLSQNKLALASGITRSYISDIETGKAIPTLKLKEILNSALERFNPANPLKMLFDYVRIRFPTDKVDHVIEHIL